MSFMKLLKEKEQLEKRLGEIDSDIANHNKDSIEIKNLSISSNWNKDGWSRGKEEYKINKMDRPFYINFGPEYSSFTVEEVEILIEFLQDKVDYIKTEGL